MEGKEISNSSVLNLWSADHQWSAAMSPVERKQGLAYLNVRGKYATSKMFEICGNFLISITRKQSCGARNCKHN